MKMRLADYVADFLVENGITHQFCVTGGGAMFLNDAFGGKEGLKVFYNHNEQGCSVAAEGYARASGKMCSVCVTTGPGGTNALTGVMGAYVDSIPMFVISGQVKFVTTVASCPSLPLRQLGDQEFPIVECAKYMTKYAVMVTDPNSIRYHLKKAFYLATHGRPGPVWLDIPINVQSALIDTETLLDYDEAEDKKELPPPPQKEQIQTLMKRLSAAKRPVILAGDGIRISDTQKEFLALVRKWGIPVCTAWNSHDLLGDTDPFSCGRPSTVGTRGGNIVLQTADFVLALGCRMNIRIISYNWENFAKNAYLASVDIDRAELEKPTLHVDLKIHADLRELLPALLKEDYAPHHEAWRAWAKEVAFRYPADLPEYYKKSTPVNPYVFMKKLSKAFSNDETVVCSNGSACVCSFQAMEMREGQRVFTNSGCASMGYGLPAAVGAAVALAGKRVICLEGDGSIQMNLQELQTVVGNQLNVKIVWLNNEGYHSIRQTQTNSFHSHFCGVSKESGVSLPEAERIAYAYRIPFFRVDCHEKIDETVQNWLNTEGFAMLEVVLDKKQFFAPKLSSKTLPDGSIVSPSLEDMFPFLSEEEKPILPETLR
ncbi:MAG: thiamine pyrophosphate-binding protein [Clostridia bacterium]|nr:thiamine pyrophosphate-binding protein [Clostridia bacterium]